jgi:hypothetical protein
LDSKNPQRIFGSDFGCTLAVLSTGIGLNGLFEGWVVQGKPLIMLDNDRSGRIAVYLSGDSKSSERKLMRVQVPPSAPTKRWAVKKRLVALAIAVGAAMIGISGSAQEPSFSDALATQIVHARL